MLYVYMCNIWNVYEHLRKCIVSLMYFLESRDMYLLYVLYTYVHNVRIHSYSFFSREIVDSKCYSLTYEFVCQLLQPVCFHEKMILPCQDFCSEFMTSCANVLPGELRDRIKCSVLKTEADGPGTCISKPGE